jgi:hypothetical protein
VQEYLAEQAALEPAFRTTLEQRLQFAQAELHRVSEPEYLDSLSGSTGADPTLLGTLS